MAVGEDRASRERGGRSDTETQPLCLRFTKTLTLRDSAEPREFLLRPSDLAEWFVAAGLGGQPPRVDEELLREARELRESIYRAARAVADAREMAPADRDRVNEWAGRGDAFRVLDGAGVSWRFPRASAARSALAVLAQDAVDTLGGVRVGTVKVCAGTGCVAVFLDATRGGFRRWCSMATCGNRAKKDAMRVRGAR
ncbi:CGNR zinc finger domain-containing protein [Streptomyces lichenis]|uniref:CGNR zinc finger domain-containing protein n=1 Tax=Streptomyces lichenis TaxID=2306967 RepID=A0ABT0IA12_9ACTN|nr:ABATE domain-containing protein [Streptomyces lichenis]MCK8678130.1 CGNR zinc finger domain-containing protein [Streptomyces lichenis]